MAAQESSPGPKIPSSTVPEAVPPTPALDQPPVSPPPSGATDTVFDQPFQPASEPTPKPDEEAPPSPPTILTTPVTAVAPTLSSGGGKRFIFGLLLGLIVASVVGGGVYFWQQDVGKAEVEAANAEVAACNEEKGRSLSAAEVWKNQFVKLSQSVNSPEWISEHCAEKVTPLSETEASEPTP